MTVSTIILAAGKGTRMKSPTPKILHKIAGRHLIDFSVDLAMAIKSQKTIAVLGEETEEATKEVLSGNKIKFCIQNRQLGRRKPERLSHRFPRHHATPKC